MGMAGRASAIAQRNSSVVSLGLIVLELYAHAAGAPHLQAAETKASFVSETIVDANEKRELSCATCTEHAQVRERPVLRSWDSAPARAQL
jgi:hypothetical protein